MSGFRGMLALSESFENAAKPMKNEEEIAHRGAHLIIHASQRAQIL